MQTKKKFVSSKCITTVYAALVSLLLLELNKLLTCYKQSEKKPQSEISELLTGSKEIPKCFMRDPVCHLKFLDRALNEILIFSPKRTTFKKI